MKRNLFLLLTLFIVFQSNAQCPKNFFKVARNGEIDSVKYYLSKGYDINCVDDYGNTVLFSVASAYSNVNLPMLDLLLEQGADLNIINKAKENILNIMINGMRDSLAFSYVLKKGVKYDMCYLKKPPLHQIIGSYAIGKHMGFVRALADNGYDLNAKCNELSVPEYYALERGRPDIALYLINKGVNIDDRSLAANLAQYGITSGYDDQNYFRRQQNAITDTLIRKGIGLNSTGGNYGAPPITYTIMYGYKNYFDLLIAKNADLQVIDEHGWTPLHAAAYRDRMHTGGDKDKLYYLKTLIEKGADINALSKGERFYSGFGVGSVTVEKGSTPLDAAILSKAPYEIIEYLKSKGGKQVTSLNTNNDE